MPAVSENPLGIPKKVAKVTANDEAGIAAGIIFVAPDGDVLLLLRSANEKNFGGHWGLPGGKAEGTENEVSCALREAREELGVYVEDEGLRVIDKVITPNGMIFTTFVKAADDKFCPHLEKDPNHEHAGWGWFPLHMLPQPLHPSVARTLGEHIGVAADMKPEEWDTLRKGFAKWTREEEAEPEHAKDAALLAMDHRYDAHGKRLMVHDIFAMDLSPSVRHYDKDGQLHVSRTPISKAMICEYYGREIPNSLALGLDPNTKYRLLRDPEELKKGAATSNGKQLMFEHTPVNAHDPKKESWIGSIGTDAEFDAPYLYNSIHVHDRMGIDGIESGEQKQLSSSYRYRADMTPGAFQGEAFDGVMRDIDFNHVTTCPAGRCGDDVFVHDSKPREFNMPKTVLSRKAAVLKGAAMAYLQPKLAMDAKGGLPAIDVTPIFAKITNGNFKASKPQIISGIAACVQGKLATDAKLDDLATFLGAFDEKEEAEDEADGESEEDKKKREVQEAKDKKAQDEKAAKDKKAMDRKMARDAMREKLPAEDRAAFDAICPAEDSEESEEEKKAKDKKARDEAPDKKPDMAAMDSAIATATEKASRDTEQRVVARFKSLRAAEEAVRPYLGETVMAFDSADDAYKAALEANEVDLTGVPASAYPALLKLVPVPGAKREPRLAMDAAVPSDSFTKMYPDATRISASH